MSFNTSTLSNSNYPTMSQTEWYNAPFNQEPNKEREFKVYVCQTLSKDTKVITDDYDLEVDDEENCLYADTKDTNWQDVYADNDCHTPIQLINLFKKCLETNLKHGIVFKSHAYTKQLIEECGDWIEDETVIDRN